MGGWGITCMQLDWTVGRFLHDIVGGSSVSYWDYHTVLSFLYSEDLPGSRTGTGMSDVPLPYYSYIGGTGERCPRPATHSPFHQTRSET